MNKELLEKLLEYINARISEESARNSEDGGLVESYLVMCIKDELIELVEKGLQ